MMLLRRFADPWGMMFIKQARQNMNKLNPT